MKHRKSLKFWSDLHLWLYVVMMCLWPNKWTPKNTNTCTVSQSTIAQTNTAQKSCAQNAQDPQWCIILAGQNWHAWHASKACQNMNGTHCISHQLKCERLNGLKLMSGRPIIAKCGSRSAYKRHLRNQEVPCVKCKEANTKYHRLYRKWKSIKTWAKQS